MTLADSLTVMLSTFVNAFVWAAEVLLATVLLLALIALICLALRWAGNKIADKRAQLVEPETYGDDGGRPTGYEWPAGPRSLGVGRKPHTARFRKAGD